MLDKNSFSIQNDFKLIGVSEEKLNIHPKHKLNIYNLSYHRKCYDYD